MCHERWLRRRSDDWETSRRMWEEFEHTRPLSKPDVTGPTEEEPTVTLEKSEPTPLATER